MRIPSIVLALLATWLGNSAAAAAQSTVPPRGEGGVSVTYQNYHHTGHFNRQGQKNTNGATESHALLMQLDFGLSDTIGLNVMLPFVASKYTGPDLYIVEGIETRPGPLDDRTYHGAFQDLRFEVRRMFLAGPVAFAPFVSVSLPTHSYETRGEAVPGRRRTEFQFGVSAGLVLQKVLTGTEIEARYAYATLERVSGWPHTRSNIDVDIGHNAGSRLRFQGLIRGVIGHKRPTVQQLQPDWLNHDRFMNPNALGIGARGTFALDRSTELYAFWTTNVRGSRGAHVMRTLAIGVSRTFGGGFKGFGG